MSGAIDTRTDVAIIGGGASGTLLAWTLSQRGVASLLVEPAERPGLGLAYATTLPAHLLNVRAEGMSADPDRPAHFTAWWQARDGAATGADFAPRMVYGDYLRALLAEARPTHLRARATGLRRDGAGFSIILSDGRRVQATRTVLATGNFPPSALAGLDAGICVSGRWHPDPWCATPYAAVAPDASVALIGTGLTTVDVILSLRAAGHRGPIAALSRHGLLPARHEATIAAPAPAIDPATPPLATALLAAFRAALADGLDWRSAIDSLRPITNPLWSAASEAEKARFRRHLQRRWEVARHRMAPPVADTIAGLRRSGTLRLHRGHVTALRHDGAGLLVDADGPDGSLTLRADHVINCTGPSLRYGGLGDPLMDGLFAQGLARPGRAGAAFALTPQGQLLGADGDAVPGLYALGPPRLGMLFESIAIPDIRRQAHDLAALLATGGQAEPPAAIASRR